MTSIEGRYCVRGVDVSRWQGDINYSAFNLDFAYVKATGGDGGLYRDGKFTRNQHWPTPWGPYHFASDGAFNAVAEADHFADAILGSLWATLPPDRKLPPVLDWEPTRNVRGSGDWVLAFLRRIEQRTGVRPMIYTGAYVALDRRRELLDYDLWLAAYTARSIPCAPWGNNWSLWQYTSSGHVAGIAGGCDNNWATVEWFDRVRSGATSIPSSPTPLPLPLPPPMIGDDMLVLKNPPNSSDPFTEWLYGRDGQGEWVHAMAGPADGIDPFLYAGLERRTLGVDRDDKRWPGWYPPEHGGGRNGPPLDAMFERARRV